MSRSHAKKTIAYNKKTIRSLFIFLLTSNLFSMFFYAYIRKYDVYNFLLKSIPELLIPILWYFSKPYYKVENGTRLHCPGIDLKSRGVVYIVFDIIYICVVVKFLTIFTSFFCIGYFLIIVSIFYEFVYRHRKNYHRF